MFGKSWGHLTSRIAISLTEEEENPILTKEDEIIRTSMEHLKDCLMTAKTPLIQTNYLNYIGYIREVNAAQKIIEGNYEFLDDQPPASRQFCIEVSKVFFKTAKNILPTFVTREYFQKWWLTAKKNISASKWVYSLVTTMQKYSMTTLVDYIWQSWISH